MAKSSRVPSAVGAIPVLGDLVKRADSQAQWAQELIEQNARMLSQLPATMKALNDSLERFNQTVGRLDSVVGRIETTATQLLSPLEQVAPNLDRMVSVATDTQRQVALLTSTIDGLTHLLNELPGAGFVRRFTGAGRPTVIEAVVEPDEPGAGN
jgi:methyl-accepting chemotaxis protein